MKVTNAKCIELKILKSVLPICILFLLNISCSQVETSIEIKVDLNDDPFKLSEILEDYSYIKLETSDSSRIGILENVQLAQGKIYVLDFIKEKSVFMFSDSGEFIKKIANSSIGLEFSAPQRIQISESTGTFQVFDPQLRGISTFTLDGEYVGLTDILKAPRSYILLDDGKYIFEYDEFPSREHRLHLVNDSLEVLEKYLHKKESLSMCIGMSLSSDKRFISYIPTFSNKVYTYQNQTFSLGYNLNFSSGWISDKEIGILSGMSYPDWSDHFERKYPLIRPDHFANAAFLAIPFLWQEEDYTIFIDKNNQFGLGPNFIDDIGVGNINKVRGVEGDYFISILDPHDLVDRYQNNEIKDPNLSAMVSNLQKEDNPILFKFKLKDSINTLTQ